MTDETKKKLRIILIRVPEGEAVEIFKAAEEDCRSVSKWIRITLKKVLSAKKVKGV